MTPEGVAVVRASEHPGTELFDRVEALKGDAAIRHVVIIDDAPPASGGVRVYSRHLTGWMYRRTGLAEDTVIDLGDRTVNVADPSS
jgi:hypothetical protein